MAVQITKIINEGDEDFLIVISSLDNDKVKKLRKLQMKKSLKLFLKYVGQFYI